MFRPVGLDGATEAVRKLVNESLTKTPSLEIVGYLDADGRILSARVVRGQFDASPWVGQYLFGKPPTGV